MGFGRVGGGDAYEYEYDEPITALKFNSFFAQGKQLLIHGCKVKGSPNMNSIQIGSKTSGPRHDVIKEFDGNVVECTVHWGGSLSGLFDTIKGLQFKTDSGETCMVGDSNSHFAKKSQIVKPPERL